MRSTNSFPSYCITIVKSIEYCYHKNLFLDFENALPSKLHFPILSWMSDHSFDSISISTTQHLDLTLYSKVVTFESSNETLLVAYNRDRRLKRECWRVQNDMCVSNKSFHWQHSVTFLICEKSLNYSVTSMKRDCISLVPLGTRDRSKRFVIQMSQIMT